jgi:phosphoribosylformylglycinamidine cyclo-ligase
MRGTIAAAIEAAGNTNIHGIAHITGGGIADNFERILPAQIHATIHRDAWKPPQLFNWLQRLGNIAEKEMFSVFNMGIGMILCVPPDVTDRVLAACSKTESPAFRLGEIRTQVDAEPAVVIA